MTNENKYSEQLLLAIHEQCEALQDVISQHYNEPCKEVVKEALYLLSLLLAYIHRHL